MKRRDFVQLTGLGLSGLMLPHTVFANPIHEEAFLETPLSVLQKKQLADVALNTAKSKGATYADVRIGRYLNQFIATRENKVQGLTSTESFGVGVRVIVNGTWGFGSTNAVTEEGVKNATERAVAVAKANSKFQTAPVNLAPVESYGEVS